MGEPVRVPVRVIHPATPADWQTPPAIAAAPAELVARAVPPERVDWHDRALRLQAEMENFRKRQQRLAEEQMQSERVRLLAAFLPVVDDLDRALATEAHSDDPLREGIELTRRRARAILEQEGVQEIEAMGQAFNPLTHEAVATVPASDHTAGPGMVARVMESGYLMGSRLLRPARVTVAV